MTPTDEETTMAVVSDARMAGDLALEIFAHFGSEPGRALSSRNFLPVATRRRINIRELSDSLDRAVEAGWLDERSDGYLVLTQSGFDRMSML